MASNFDTYWNWCQSMRPAGFPFWVCPTWCVVISLETELTCCWLWRYRPSHNWSGSCLSFTSLTPSHWSYFSFPFHHGSFPFGMVTPLFNLWLLSIRKEGKNLDRWSIREGSEASYFFFHEGVEHRETGIYCFPSSIYCIFFSPLHSRRQGKHWEGWVECREHLNFLIRLIKFSHHVYCLQGERQTIGRGGA